MERTAIMEAIERIREKKIYESNSYKVNAYAVSIDILASLLPKAREQIMDAFVAGDNRGSETIPFNCEQYFTQTYGETKWPIKELPLSWLK